MQLISTVAHGGGGAYIGKKFHFSVVYVCRISIPLLQKKINVTGRRIQSRFKKEIAYGCKNLNRYIMPQNFFE